MREELRDPLRLKHIVEAIERINSFMTGKEEKDLSGDSLLYYAVVKNIEIVGEAAYMLTPAFKEFHAETPWRQIVAMRHILVHGYYKVNPSEVYNVYKSDLPILLAQMRSYLTKQ